MGIPLPALSIKPPEQPNILEEYGRIMQLKNIAIQGQTQQIENQKATLALQDDAKIRSAVQMSIKSDGTFDEAKFTQNAYKQGAGAAAVMNFQKGLLGMRQAQATLDKDAIENGIKQNDQYRGRLLSIINGPEADKLNAWDKEIAAEEKAGAVQPGTVTRVYPGDDTAQSIADHFAIGSTLAKEAAEKQQAAAKAIEAETASKKFAAEQPGIVARGQISQQEAAMSPTDRGLAGNLPYQAAGGNKQAQTALSLETQQKVAAAKAATAGAPGAVAGVAPHLVGPATNAFDKAGQEYASAYQAAQNMSDFIQQAKSGNKEAVKIVPLQGALEITTAQGVHRINRTEVDQFGGAGSLYDKLAGRIGGIISGKDISDTVLNDMDALQKTVSQNAAKLHANKVAVINTSYGSKFEPMDFSKTQNKSGGPPAGATMKVPGSDGKMHWSDGKKDLGVVE